MKTWLFALLQAMIAVLGLAAYFLADNVVLATSAAAAAALLGIAQPIITAHRGRKLELYRDRQFEKSLEAVDGQIADLLGGTIEPPLPDRPTIAAVFRRDFPDEAARLLKEYDRFVEGITAGGPHARALAADLVVREDPRDFPKSLGSYAQPLADYLHGQAALTAGKLEPAHGHFSRAKGAHPAWVSPWLGWACTAYRLGRFDEICEQHPHLNGVELLPYDAGDEQTFLDLTEEERAQLAESFQQTSASLGNYYAIAECCRSKQQLAASQEELRQVA